MQNEVVELNKENQNILLNLSPSLSTVKQKEIEEKLKGLKNSFKEIEIILPKRIITFNKLHTIVADIENNLLAIEQWIFYHDPDSEMVTIF